MTINKAFLEEFTKIRQHIHKYPELSEQEYQTTEYIKNFLSKKNIRIIDTNLKTGVIAEIGSGNDIIGLRADIDALPIIEETGLEYASVNHGVMHACGHDFHTASLLAAATLLKEQENILPGTVRLVFQPAEENFQGARTVIETNAVNDIRAFVGFHNDPNLPLGTLGYRKDKLLASVDHFLIKIRGIGSHAAHPEQGSDPIITGTQIINNLQAIITRHTPANEQSILSITRINSGSTWNVIPEYFEFEGTLRTLNEENRQHLKSLIYKTIENTTDIYGQTVEIEWTTGPTCLNNNSQLFDLLLPDLTNIFEDSEQLESSLGGEDFAFYQDIVPIFFACIGTGKKIPLHHPGFLIDDAALAYSVRYYIQAVESLFNIKLR